MIRLVTAPAWMRGLPKDADAVSAFPACDEEEPFELGDLHIVDASSAVAVFLDRPELVNIAMQRCDVAGFGATEGRADRVLIEQSRLRNVTWASGIVQDGELDHVIGSEVSFRFSTLRRITFRDCKLPELDLTEVTFEAVRFERCDLSGAHFDHARVKSLRIEGCDLTGCSGALALAGTSIHPDDVLSLGPSLATALGLTIE
jgi:uncharacterized protein YjbI with pentapeptide repeats